MVLEYKSISYKSSRKAGNDQYEDHTRDWCEQERPTPSPLFSFWERQGKSMGHIEQVAHSASCIDAIDKQVISEVTKDRYKKDL